MTDLTPADLLSALREVVGHGRVSEGPIVLREDAKENTCPPVHVSCAGLHWALRVKHSEHLPLLAGSSRDTAKSFRKLPDYLIFAEPPGTRRDSSPDLVVVVCELKSSAGDVRAGAKRQVQLGKFLAEYLIRLVLFARGKAAQTLTLHIVGVILSRLCPKGGTTPDERDDRRKFDDDSHMWMWTLSSDDDLRVAELFR